MKKSYIKINNKGFTLTEIVVVMILLGLIIILATSITLIVNHSRQLTQLDSKDEGELLKLRTVFDDWLLLYDSDNYILTVSEHKVEASDESLLSTETDTFLSFESGQLTYSENVGYEPQAVQVIIEFTAIKDITFDICDVNIICCTVHFDSVDYKIISHLRAAIIERSRT